MLNPRRENSAAIRASTPGLFSTRTDRVCLLIGCRLQFSWEPVGTPSCPGRGPARPPRTPRGPTAGRCPARPGSRSLLTPAGTIGQTMASRCTTKSTTTGRSLISIACADRRVDVLRSLAPQPDAAVGVGELDEVGDAAADRGVQVGVGVALVVEQRLPLAHHAEAAVVDDRDLDRDVVDDAGGELLVGHLEAAVAVDGPHGALRLGDLGAHGGRHGIPHRAEATGVEPRVGALVLDELGGPHLVLADPRDVDGLGPGDAPDAAR